MIVLGNVPLHPGRQGGETDQIHFLDVRCSSCGHCVRLRIELFILFLHGPDGFCKFKMCELGMAEIFVYHREFLSRVIVGFVPQYLGRNLLPAEIFDGLETLASRE